MQLPVQLLLLGQPVAYARHLWHENRQHSEPKPVEQGLFHSRVCFVGVWCAELCQAGTPGDCTIHQRPCDSALGLHYQFMCLCCRLLDFILNVAHSVHPPLDPAVALL